ncbi:MAG: catalase, partial [Propionibacterium sp.]|nr:catalase [Propionibacterium sp.]
PYEEAKTYKVNPFDVTKTIPKGDYPRIKVGTMTLNRNPQNFFAQIEQAAFEPSSLVPGIGLSPDKMLLGRVFSYADTHRHRIGPNYLQLPVNRPKTEVQTYAFDGPMTYDIPSTRTPYAPNSEGRPYSDLTGPAEDSWEADGELVRLAATVRGEQDTDFAQPGILVREVMTDEERAMLVDNVVGHLSDGVHGDVLARAFQYWKNVDQSIGDRIEAQYHEQNGNQDGGRNT